MTKTKKKVSTKPRKRKGKVVVRESVKVRPKTTAKRDTVPTRTSIPDNGVTFKVKIRKK